MMAPEIWTLVLAFSCGLFTAGLLGPHDLGVLRIVGLVAMYAPLLGLGTREGAIQQAPALVGRDQPEEARKLLDVAFSFTVTTTLIIAVPALLLCYFFHLFSTTIIFGLAMLTVQLLFYEYTNSLTGKHRIFFRFHYVSRVRLIQSTLNAIGKAAGSWWAGLWGAFLSNPLSWIIPALYLKSRKEEHLVFRWEPSTAFQLMKVGFPILAGRMLSVLFDSLDRWFLLGVYHAQAVGYYSFAFTIPGLLLMMAIRGISVFAQYLRVEWGSHHDSATSWGYTRIFFSLILLASLPASLLAAEALRLILHHILPQYRPGEIFIPPLFLAVNLQIIFHLFNAFFTAIEQLRSMVKYQIMAVVLSALANVAAVTLTRSYGMVAIAWATVIANLMLVLLQTIALARQKHYLSWQNSIVFLFTAIYLYGSLWLMYSSNSLPQNMPNQLAVRLGLICFPALIALPLVFKLRLWPQLVPLFQHAQHKVNTSNENTTDHA
ncbi:MAG: hypothetical protein D6820_11105 [Lentisphaerae bacterium]|nr:MAG: hypothetical protein D6820_11105 [Lentisphaerota bacterium]